MFVVSFRIPLASGAFNQKFFANGSTLSEKRLDKGTQIGVMNRLGSFFEAEVIESITTQREAGSFEYTLYHQIKPL